MIAYIDASVLLRIALRQPNALREWRQIDQGVSSALILGTLDAIHLATALLWKESTETGLVMASHDGALALAAQAHGLNVVGVPRT